MVYHTYVSFYLKISAREPSEKKIIILVRIIVLQPRCIYHTFYILKVYTERTAHMAFFNNAT